MKSPRTILRRTGPASGSAVAESAGAATATIQAQLAELRTKQVTVANRLTMAAQTVAAAGETRRHLLLADRIDETALARAEKACTDAASAHGGIEDALAHVTRQIATFEAQIAGEADQTERDRVASELEARAERLTKAAVNLDRAAEAYDEQRREVLRVAEIDGPIDLATMATAAGPILRGGAHLSGAAPLSEVESIMGGPVSAYHGAHRVVEAMKAQAAGIRAGELPAVLPARSAPYIHVAFPDVPVTLSRPVQWNGHLGVPQIALAGGVMLPKPVAEAAILAGVGFPDDSADAAGIRRVAGRYPAGTCFKRDGGNWIVDAGPISSKSGKHMAQDMFLPLGVNLHQHAETKRAKLRAAA